MALPSLLGKMPALGRTGRTVHALLPAAGSRLMSQDHRPDSICSSEQEVLATQREEIDRLRADYEKIRGKLNEDMDALIELMRKPKKTRFGNWNRA